ncbi:MAG: WG repeat-containing protein [Acetatifactor sp.]|nr:WG repeat-containing protein [Acetatifactor sp.]
MDRLENTGKRKIFVLTLLLLAIAAGIVFIRDSGKDNAGETQEYVNVEETEELLEEGEASGEYSAAEEAAGHMQYPRIIHSDLTQDIDIVFMTEEVYCIYNGDVWFYMTQEGEALTADTYTMAYPFHEGLACACKGGKYGFIDVQGRTVIDFVYDRAAPFVEDLAYFCKDDSYGFMDRTGTPMFYLDCDSVSAFQEGLAYISVDGKYGYIDRTGEMVVEPIYDNAGYFQDGFAIVWQDYKQGVIDRTGKEIIPSEYVDIERKEDYFLAEKGGKLEIFDKGGNTILDAPCDLGSGYQWSEINLRYDEEGKTGFIHEGEAIFFDKPYIYEAVIHDRELAIAREDEYWGVIDFQGEIKIPFSYSRITYDKNEGVFIVSDDEYGKGIIDADDFSQSVVCSYSDIGDYVNGQAVVRMGEKYGTIDASGYPVMPVAYNRIRLLENGAYWYKEGEKSYLYDADGALLNVGDYDYIMLEGSCYVTQKSYSDYGLLNAAGEEILEPVYGGYYSESLYYGTVVLSGSDYRDGYTIVRTQEGENKSEGMDNFFLYNEITPRISPFWALLKDETIMRDMDEYFDWSCTRDSYRLYDFDHQGMPILEVYFEPYVQEGPGKLSYSGFYGCQGEAAMCLLSGYECGGTAGGNYVCLWYDNEEEKLLLGDFCHTGGFGGYAESCGIYDYADGQISARVSLEWISQGSYGYSEEELLENAELYYDGSGQPYTRETILDAGVIEEYSVNGELTTMERYQEVKERYRLMY